MPEPAEISALAERLAERVMGHAFAGAVPLSFSGLKTVVPPPQSLIGEAVRGIGRRGKSLAFKFRGAPLPVHLFQGRPAAVPDPPEAATTQGVVGPPALAG